MPLSIYRDLKTSGAQGANGRTPAWPEEAGDSGTAGKAGKAARAIVQDETFLGTDEGADSVRFLGTLWGGRGGDGGSGLSGLSATATSYTIQRPDLRQTTYTYDAAESGGAAGRGGKGGLAEALFLDLMADLGGGGDRFEIVGISARGNQGGSAGLPGKGGNGGEAYLREEVSLNSQCRDPFTRVSVSGGAPGGAGGAGADGAAGGAGTAAVRGLDLTNDGTSLYVNLAFSAYGGAGGSGNRGGSGGVGSIAGSSQDGGKGGKGGAALAEVTGLSVHDLEGQGRIYVDLRAFGGSGGNGGNAAGGAWGERSEYYSDSCIGSTFVEEITYGPHGAAGRGGAGGAATARFADSSILLDDLNDTVSIFLWAVGGAGGRGGGGVQAVESSGRTVVEGSFTGTYIVTGTAAAPGGKAGAAGRAEVVLENVVIDLGGGNDDLMIEISGTGAAITVRGNSFDGGAGYDRLSFNYTQIGVTVDLQRGEIGFGGATPANRLADFEEIRGTYGNDVFIDGAGNQTYDIGSGGSDVLEFRPGHGDDTIRWIGGDDTLRLIGFGPALDSFEEVLAAATGSGSGLVIDTGEGNALLLERLYDASSLTAEMFAFA